MAQDTYVTAWRKPQTERVQIYGSVCAFSSPLVVIAVFADAQRLVVFSHGLVADEMTVFPTCLYLNENPPPPTTFQFRNQYL
jgi:hypothetical protein